MFTRILGSGNDQALTLRTQVTTPRYFAGLFFLLFAVTQLPLYWVEYPDIVDLANHLARMHVQTRISESEALQKYYVVRDLRFGTNLAMEVMVPALAKSMDVEIAVKVFASVSMLLVTTGAVALGRVITGHLSNLQLGVFFFSHNAALHMGLFNYLFGLGVAFWLLSAWILTQDRDELWRPIAFAVGCVAVYLCHISALGVYAIGVAGYQWSCVCASPDAIRPSRVKNLLLALTQFIPVAVAHLLVSSSAGTYVPPPVTGSAMMNALSWVVYKASLLAIAPSVCISGYSFGQAVFGFLLVCFLYAGFREGVLKLAVPVGWMAGALAAAILLLPPSGFGSNVVDIRLIPALGLLVWSGLEVSDFNRLIPKVVMCSIAAGVLLISLETAREWGARDDEYRQARNALARIPEGARVATVVLDKYSKASFISPHTAAWSIIDRSAFLSSFYVWPFQPFRVAYREPYARLAALARTDTPGARPPTYESLSKNFDYVFVFGGDGVERMRYAPSAETVGFLASSRLIRTGTTLQVQP